MNTCVNLPFSDSLRRVSLRPSAEKNAIVLSRSSTCASDDDDARTERERWVSDESGDDARARAGACVRERAVGEETYPEHGVKEGQVAILRERVVRVAREVRTDRRRRHGGASDGGTGSRGAKAERDEGGRAD
jgi:hypothetical protein